MRVKYKVGRFIYGANPIVPVWSQDFSNNDNPTGLALAVGHVFVLTRTSPSKLYKVDPANPPAYSTTTFASDGKHNSGRHLILGSDGMLYALFGPFSGNLVVSQINPTTLAITDVIDDATYPNTGAGQMVEASGSLFIVQNINPNTQNKLLKYNMSGFAFQAAYNLVSGAFDLYSAHSIGWDGSKLYVAGGSNASTFDGWVARIATDGTIEQVYLAYGGTVWSTSPSAQIDVSTNYIWLGSGTGADNVLKISKSDLTSYVTALVIPSLAIYGGFFDGVYMWIMVENGDNSDYHLYKTDPTSFAYVATKADYVPTTLGGYSRIVSDGTLLYVTVMNDSTPNSVFCFDPRA